MSQILIKMVFNGSLTVKTSPPTINLGFLRDPNHFLIRLVSTSSIRQPFTTSYLKNSIGLSSEDALKLSRSVNLQTSENADEIIKLFKNRGFTETQISRLVRSHPRVLSADVEKTILPKLEFLESKGISGPEMAKVLPIFPRFLFASLANQILPSYDLLRNVFQSDEKLTAAIKRCPAILLSNFEKVCAPKIDILREHGVPDSRIATLVQFWTKSSGVNVDDFRKIVNRVQEMGFDASKVSFVIAVHALSMSQSRWETKVGEYKKWEFSEEEVLKAFRKCPWWMTLSEDKLMASMDFFINQMGWRPCVIAESPEILTLSLEKRVVPRCSVFRVLLSKGLVEKDASLNSLLKVPEEKFLQRFVAPYMEEVPELLTLYKQKLKLSKRMGDEV